MSNKKLLLLPLFLFPLVVILSQCISKSEAKDPRGDAYIGSASCNSCHKDIGNSIVHTAHFMASLPGTAQSIHGSPLPGANSVQYNDHTRLLMTQTDSGFYQTNYVNNNKMQSARIDIVMGGIKGESYLYWNENQLFQLPVSYDNLKNHWIVSPGYDTTIASFDRAITLRCMECHASYAKPEAPKLASFNPDPSIVGFEKGSLILGVDCERCHGGARQHVEFQTENPTVKQAKYITKISSLNRQQKMSLCGTCHSGTNTVTTRSIFDFKPGDNLADFKKHAPTTQPLDFEHIDVHGDQLDMLKTSKCFISSKMDCNSCHNTHKNEHNNQPVYARRCMTCHQPANHKAVNGINSDVLKANCIACHMPELPSKAIVNEQESVLVRTHHIAIYPDKVAKIVAFINKK